MHGNKASRNPAFRISGWKPGFPSPFFRYTFERMSKSFRRTSIIGRDCAASEKPEKCQAHRIERRLVREILRLDHDADVLPHLREISDVWVMTKDGKGYFDPKFSPELMRK